MSFVEKTPVQPQITVSESKSELEPDRDHKVNLLIAEGGGGWKRRIHGERLTQRTLTQKIAQHNYEGIKE